MVTTISGDKFHEVWDHLTQELLDKGKTCSPRKKPTLELLNVTLSVKDSRHNILHNVGRSPNYRSMVAEWLWILFGHNDVASIASYIKKYDEFSDDGKTLSGAYGPAVIRGIERCVTQLGKDIDTRQAVIPIWNQHQQIPSKDVPCLSGDTTFHSPEGNITIKELVNKFKLGLSKYPVLSFDTESRCLSYRWCTNAWYSGKKRAVKITFNDNSTIVATPDHKIYQKIRRKTEDCLPRCSKTIVHEVSIGNLRIGDRVWATHFKIQKKSKHTIFIEDLGTNWDWCNQKSVHTTYDRFLRGPIPVGMDVHHHNGVKTDNSENNLIRIMHDEHGRIERYKYNAIIFETEEKKTKRIKRLKQTYKEKGYNVKELRTNHVVTKIEDAGDVDVYDFTVKDSDNAVLSSGVIIHNCTISLQFLYRDDKLHTIVNMRSSDVWLGLVYDFYVFSQIANIVCGLCDFHQGSLTFHIGSSHLYKENIPELTIAKRHESSSLPSPNTPQYLPPLLLDDAFTNRGLELVIEDFEEELWFWYYKILRARTKLDALKIMKDMEIVWG